MPAWASVRTRLVLGAIVLGAFLLRLPGLRESLWYDELWSTRVMLSGLPDLIDHCVVDTSPAVYYFLMFGWIRMFGDSELSVRIPPLVFGLLSVALTCFLARRWLSERAALLSAFLLAVSPVHIWYSQEARPYSAGVFCVLAAILAFYRVQESERPGAWLVAYAAALWGAVFLHFYLAGYLCALSLLCLIRPTPNRRGILLVNGLAAASVALLWGARLALGTAFTSMSYLRSFSLTELWALLLHWFPTGNAVARLAGPGAGFRGLFAQPLPVAMSLLVLAALTAGLVHLFRKLPRERFPDLPLFLLTVPASLLLLNAAGFSKTYIERSALTALPFFMILVSAGLWSAANTRLQWVPLAVCAVFVAAVLVNYYRKSDRWTVYKPNPDWKSASRYFSAELAASPGFVLVFTGVPSAELTYYDPRFAEERELLLRDYRKRRLNTPPSGPFSGLKLRLRQFFWAMYPEGRMPSPGGIIYDAGSRDPEAVRALVLGSGSRNFYVVRNLFWLGSVDALRAGFQQDRRFRLAGRYEAKGLQVFKYSLENSTPAPDGGLSHSTGATGHAARNSPIDMVSRGNVPRRR